VSGLSAVVSQTTSTLRWTSVGVISFSLFAMVWAAASDTSGFIYRYSARYVASLDRKLRPMFIFVPNGKPIAYGQMGAFGLLMTAHALLTVDYWWGVTVVIMIGPTVYIEMLRRKRVEALEMLSKSSLVKLDEERKAAMVSNLLVVLCSDKETQPIVNTGTLYN